MNSQMSKPNDLQRIIKSSFETTKTQSCHLVLANFEAV